jgi:hypothetical protein
MKIKLKNIVLSLGVFFFFTFLFLIASSFYNILKRIVPDEGHIEILKNHEEKNMAVKDILFNSLPISATNVYYKVLVAGIETNHTEAVFLITEDEFSSWLSQKQKSWRLEKKKFDCQLFDDEEEKKIGRLIGDIKFECRDKEGKHQEIIVQSPYYFEGRRPNADVFIIFDKNRNTCYIELKRKYVH